MKLPEYDNRPLPGEKLYRDTSGDEWADVKFPALVLLLVIGLVVAFLAIFTGFGDILRGLLH
jgi:hypothetical protein